LENYPEEGPQLKLNGLRVDIFVGIFVNGGSFGLSLSEKTIRLASELGLPLGFDMYAGDFSNDGSSAKPLAKGSGQNTE
jgi:hypothetical protein